MTFFDTNYFITGTVDVGYVESQTTRPSRIYAQYRNKPKAVQWYNITLSLAASLGDVAQAVRLMYDIDYASGNQLDIIGAIVVIPRNFTGYVSLNPTMFASAANNPGEFGDASAMFSETSIDADAQMSDELYRLAIKSKILKNNSFTTIEDILYGMNFLLPNAQTLRVSDGEDMSFSVEFYGKITDLQRWALLNQNFVPKPQGVKFNGFLEAYDYSQFGDVTAEFGDTTAEFTGYTGV